MHLTEQGVKWGMGGLAVVASFLLVQGDVTILPIVKVGIGAFLVFAAYVNPSTIVNRFSSTP